jgi:hypothetical protein
MSWESLCVRAAAQAAPSLRVRLAGPATSRERGARREQDAPMQLQAGRGRVLVCSCRARTTRHQNLRIRMVNARPDALTRLQAPAGHLPADSCGLFSLQSACSLRYAAGMHVRSRQQLDYFRKAAAGGTCARHHSNHCDLIETTAPEWLPLAACGNAPDECCISADRRASGRPWATAVALPSHT